MRLDLNNPVFQAQLFKLSKQDQLGILGTLKKILMLTWNQVYVDKGLNWEAILSKTGPHGSRLHTIRVSKKFRAVVYRKENQMRFLTLHPDHNSAYH